MLTQSTSPRSLSRLGGALYLVIIVGGLLGEALVRGRVVVAGDAAATAANLRALRGLWRAAMAGELFMLLCATVLAVILFVLLRPVSRDLALLGLVCNAISIAIEAVNEQRLLAALLPLAGFRSLTAFTAEQLQAMSQLALVSYEHGFATSLLFFGCECLVLGWLIARCGYLPRTIGALMAVAGACYVINSFAVFAAPRLASRLFPAILLPCLVGEATLCGWLLLRGVDERRWPGAADAGSTASLPPGS